MSDFLDDEGKPIPEDQLAPAVASGAANVAADSRVHMLDPAGRPVTLPSDQVGVAVDAGYVPESTQAIEARRTSKEYGTIGQKAVTAAEGAGRGLTFGLTDMVATGLGGENYRRAALARKQTNPITAGVGEVAGALAPLVLTGGGSGAASGAGFFGRAATAVPRGAEAISKALLPFATAETAAGRMALRAAQTGVAGALEGALYGAGQTVGGLTLSGDQITAEKVLSGAGQGALVGGLLGAAGGAVASRLSERGAPAARLAAEGAGEDGALLSAKIDRLESNMRKAGASDERVAAAVARETDKAAARASKIDQFAGSAAMRDLGIPEASLRKTGATAADVDGLLAQAGQDYLSYRMQSGPLAGKRIFSAAKNPVDLLDDIAHAHAETRAEMDGYLGVADHVAATAPELAPDYATISQRFTDAVDSLKDKRLARTLERDYGTPLRELAAPTAGPPSFRVAAELRDALSEEVGRLGASKGAPLRSVRDALDDALEDAVESTLTKAGMDPRAFSEAKRMNQSLGLVKDTVEDLKFNKAVSSKGIDSNALGYALVGALTGNLAGAAKGVAGAIGKDWLQKRAGGIVAELAHRVARTDVKLGWGAKALAGDAVRATGAAAPAFKGARAQQVYSAIQDAVATPEAQSKYAAGLTERFAAQYPELAMQVQQQAIGDLQFLAAAIPQRASRGDATLTPAAVKSSPGSRATEAKFWEQLRAIEDPGTVIDALMEGKLPLAGIEALKARRPAIYAEMREQVMTETAARSKELPYKRRVSLGLAFDFTSDKSLQPGMLSNIQQTISSATMPPTQARPPTATTMAAADKTAAAMALPGQEI